METVLARRLKGRSMLQRNLSADELLLGPAH